ncbi:hypothetical protein TNCV_4516191 [Trichonephila clavipes]|nr:hypothetical protein TNCV_4516191 [Trichonephila clavipes]
MSSRHHIDDFMRGRIIGKIEEGRKITDVAREFDIIALLFTAGSHLKLLECSRRHGEVLEVRRLQKSFIVLSAKRNSAHSSAGGKSVFAASGKQISRKVLPDV